VHQRNYVAAGKAALTHVHPKVEYRHANGASLLDGDSRVQTFEGQN
jgi:hypothetical protein